MKSMASSVSERCVHLIRGWPERDSFRLRGIGALCPPHPWLA
jgi:hypothetical protein